MSVVYLHNYGTKTAVYVFYFIYIYNSRNVEHSIILRKTRLSSFLFFFFFANTELICSFRYLIISGFHRNAHFEPER